MASDKEDIESAEVLARQMLEAGIFFKKRVRHVAPQFGGRFQYEEAPLPIYDPATIRKLNLTPAPEIAEGIRSMLLAKHAEFQANRGKRRNNSFFISKAWKTLRYQVLSERGGKRECCGATAAGGAELHVDHIKPRSKYPELALEKANLQVLCKDCNLGKSNRHEDDWRHDRPKGRLCNSLRLGLNRFTRRKERRYAHKDKRAGQAQGHPQQTDQDG